MIHGHGDNQYQFSEPLQADFSSNVRFDGCPEALIGFLGKKLELIAHYPEPDGQSLRALIAEKHRLNSHQIILCNGSSDGFYQLAQAFANSNSAVLIPSFSEYEDACRMNGHQLQFFEKQEFADSSFENADMVWLGNPNNPDGFVFDLGKIRKKLEAFPKTVFVIDEAYESMCPACQSCIRLTVEFENLVVCRSLTKAYGIPGIRLGYLVCSDKLSKRISRFNKPWAVNSLAIEAGKFILQNETILRPDVDKLIQYSFDLQLQIDILEGFKVVNSKAGFFLVEMESGKSSELKEYLLREYAVLIRDASNFRGLEERFFRVGVQTKEKNMLLLKALKAYSRNHSKWNQPISSIR